MKVGSGPAAVIGDESRKFATVTFERDGKARQVERSESQKTCPGVSRVGHVEMAEIDNP